MFQTSMFNALLCATILTASTVASPVGTLTGSAPLARRSVIAHDAVVGFAEAVPDTTEGALMLKYKPYLKVFNGCVPFPAVDAEGNTSGGLDKTGASNGDCSSSTGQVYTRAGTYNGAFGIMYSWYMPKDEPSDGLGHRHDWENAVVWLSSASDSATVKGIAVSQHGDYVTTTSPDMSSNGHPLVGYISYWPLDHCLIETDTVGGMQPLIAWDSLTDAARSALETTDFGSATVPFKSNFESYLEAAYFF